MGFEEGLMMCFSRVTPMTTTKTKTLFSFLFAWNTNTFSYKNAYMN